VIITTELRPESEIDRARRLMAEAPYRHSLLALALATAAAVIAAVFVAATLIVFLVR
jgi:hypothetical protein